MDIGSVKRIPFIQFSLFLLWSMASLCLSCVTSINVPHTTEEIIFHSDRFELVGDLRTPETGGPHPIVVMVHGDGPNDRTSFGTYLPLMNCFLGAGYACFSWDKPGSGESTGAFTREHLQQERAQILVDAIKILRTHPSIDSTHIGVWGISQAGYVMPRALTMTDDISFLIGVGCPGEDGIRQTAYLIQKQMMCKGVSREEARQAEDHFVEIFKASTYQEYLSHARPLVENPTVKRMGFVSGIWSEKEWQPHDPSGEPFYNPIDIIGTTSIPVLLFFGEKDTQVDPFQGSEAYETTLVQAGNQHFRIEIIPDADHNIILCKTGCMSERDQRSRSGWKKYAPQYLDIMADWLKGRTG